MYLLRALPLEVVRPELPHLDQLFETFVASTLCFEEGYSESRHAVSYDRALQQVRHGIKSGGFGLTPSTLLAPAASYVAFRDFHAWYFSLATHWKDSAAHYLSWLTSKLAPPVSTQEPARIVHSGDFQCSQGRAIAKLEAERQFVRHSTSEHHHVANESVRTTPMRQPGSQQLVSGPFPRVALPLCSAQFVSLATIT